MKQALYRSVGMWYTDSRAWPVVDVIETSSGGGVLVRYVEGTFAGIETYCGADTLLSEEDLRSLLKRMENPA